MYFFVADAQVADRKKRKSSLPVYNVLITTIHLVKINFLPRHKSVLSKLDRTVYGLLQPKCN